MREIPPPFAHYEQQMRIFAGKLAIDVATQPQLAAIIYRGEFRLDWAPVVEQSLIITHKGFWS